MKVLDLGIYDVKMADGRRHCVLTLRSMERDRCFGLLYSLHDFLGYQTDEGWDFAMVGALL